MGFSRQQFWSRLPFPPPGDLPDPGIEHASPAFLALAGGFFTTNATWASFLTLLSFSSEIVPNFQNYCKKQRFMDCRVIGIQRQSLPCRTQGVPHHTWPVACFDGDKERVKRAGKLTGPWWEHQYTHTSYSIYLSCPYRILTAFPPTSNEMMTQRDDRIMSIIVRRLKFLPCFWLTSLPVTASGMQVGDTEPFFRDRGHCSSTAGSVELHVLRASSGAPRPMGVMLMWAQVAAVHTVDLCQSWGTVSLENLQSF